jgi:hypothetical protein
VSILGDDSNGRFHLGWFRGGKARTRPTPEEVEDALAWARSQKGKPYIGPADVVLPGNHLLVARLGCGCVVIHCPQQPDMIYLPGAGGCSTDHNQSEPAPNETPASVGSSTAPSNADGISAEALTLAAGGMAEFPGIYCVPQVSQDPIYDRLARSALAAAMPELRRQIAEEIAVAIEAERDPDFDTVVNRNLFAGRLAEIARGRGKA